MYNVGRIEEYDIEYDYENDNLYCKDNVVSVTDLLNAYTGSVDRLRLTESLIYRKHDTGGISVGCLTFSQEHAKQIHKEIIKVKIKNKVKTKK